MTHTEQTANAQPPAGVDPQTWSAAQTACASVRPSHAPTSTGS
jgi:hypothetical protein